MKMLSTTEVFEDKNNRPETPGPGGADVSAVVQAATRTIRIIGDVLLMLAVVLLTWFAWRQVLPFLWPAGPALLIAPGFWYFMGGSIILRAIWSVLFLCPRVR